MTDWSSIISKALSSTADSLMKGSSSGSTSKASTNLPTVDFTKNMMGTTRQNVQANQPSRPAQVVDPQEAIQRWQGIFANSMRR